MRILWHSNAPWIRTGYGGQTAVWAPRFASLGHEVVISGPFSFAGSPMTWGGFTVLPGAQDPFGSDVIAGHYRRNGCDLMITLCDVFMMDPAAMRGLHVVHWLPVDCESNKGMGKGDAEKAECAAAVIAISQFGADQMRMRGFSPFYVPHGIDTAVFSPPEDKKQHRVDMGFDPDMFLVGVNAANKAGPRKGIQEQVIAFAEFHKRHPDTQLLMHTFAQPREGSNVKALADELGVSNAIVMPDQYAYATGLMEESTMARWYKSLDLLSNASYGEGFGIPLIEAQACGVPAVVTNCSSMTELCGAGWKVAGDPFWVDGHDAFWRRPSIAGIVGAYEAAYELCRAGEMPQRDAEPVTWAGTRAAARAFAVQYDADHVLETYWKPVLEALDEQRPRTRRREAAAMGELPVYAAPEGKRDLLLVVPSRGRPESVLRLIGAVASTAALRTDVVVGLDDDDPSLGEYMDMVRAHPASPGHERVRVMVEVGPRQGLAAWTNELVMPRLGGYAAVASFGDDHVPVSAGWDEALVRAATDGGPGFAYPNDGVRDDIPQAVVAASEAVAALGWLCEPSLTHYFVDNTWAELGRFSQSLTYLPDVMVEHRHHLKMPGVVAHDATYKEKEPLLMTDMAEFERWRVERMAGDVAKIRALRG
jgi:glycosyltransferase involved in cell wall biosynthesis